MEPADIKNLEDHIKISIGIPTYNGSERIRETLDCLVDQYQDGMEIILCDDASTDDTYQIISEYADKYPYISVSQNETNLGMDANFKQTALNAIGEYLWLFGQDDLMQPGCISYISSILANNNNISILYINYSQNSHDMGEVLVSSYFDKVAIDKSRVQTDINFTSAEDYFSVLDDLPSFLPATITRREYWLNTDLEPFLGTAYIQMGLMYLNIDKGKIYTVAKPYIIGRIPDNQWQADGTKHFNVLTGALKMYGIVRRETGYPPDRTFYYRHFRYLVNFFFHVHLCKSLGLNVSDSEKSLLQDVYGNGVLYRLYLLPILSLPPKVLVTLNVLLLPLKRLILLFRPRQ